MSPVGRAVCRVLAAVGLVSVDCEILLAAEPVRVTVDSASDQFFFDEKLGPFLVVEPLTEQSADRLERPYVVRTKLGETVELTLPTGAYTITAYANGYWGTTAEVVVPGLQAISLKLWPAGTVQGQLTPPELTQDRLRVRFTPSAKDRTEPSGEAKCSLEQRQLTCAVPLGQLDLRFRAPGFMGAYFWDVTIRNDEPANLGEIRCDKGSSLVGFVEFDGVDQQRRATVQLKTADGKPVARSNLGRESSITASTNHRGFWQMKNVPHGEYLVVASAAGLDETKAIVHVFPARETTYGVPLVLSPPHLFEFYVDPPLDPQNEPWSVRLFRKTHGEQIEPITVAAREPGAYTTTLRRGHYRLMLASPTMGKVHTEEFEFGPDSAPIHISLNFTRVVGRLRLGLKPIAGTLSFGGTSGPVSIHMNADESGRFQGQLPRAGVWSVSINSTKPRLTRFLSDVHVEESNSGIAVVNIDLPNTRIAGVALDDRHQPVVNATITVFRGGQQERPQPILTNQRGEFEFRGLAEDLYTITGSATRTSGEVLESDPMTIDTKERLTDANQLSLILHPSRKLHGRVVSALGPLANAKVLAIPENGLGMASQADTGIDGEFLLQLRRDARQLTLVASAPGFSLRLLTLQNQYWTSSLEIPLVRNGGTLVVELLASKSPTPDVDFSRLVLVREATWVPLTALHQWATLNGGGHEGPKLVIPQLEPGPYSVCSAARVMEGIRPNEHCNSGVLSPGQELVLSVRISD